MTLSSSSALHLPPSTILSGVPKSAEALVLAELLDGKYATGEIPGLILHIAESDRGLERIASALAFFAPEVEVLRFPAWDSMPYDRISPQTSIMAARMQVLSALSMKIPSPVGGGLGWGHRAGEVSSSHAPLPASPLRGKGVIVLTTISAATQKLPPREVLLQAVIELRTGQAIKQGALVGALSAQGYRRAGKAMEPGEFALRGGIIDIVPPGMSEGIRIDLFGDDIESMKPFDPLTQLTSGTVNELKLYPVSEVLLSEATAERFRTGYRELFGAVTKEDPLYESVSTLAPYPGMEHWLPLFYERADTLFDYCAGATITLDTESTVSLEERFETIYDYYGARRDALTMTSKKNSFAAGSVYHPLPPERMFLMETEWKTQLSRQTLVRFSPFGSEGISVDYRPALPFTQGQPERTPFTQLKENADAARGKPVLLACFSEGSRERIFTLLMEHDFHCVKIDRWDERGHVRGKAIGLCVVPLENGFETDDALLLSEQDVLGERIARITRRKKKSDIFMAEAANLMENELVVHKEHGIGRFEGLITLTVSGASHDCLKLVYDGGDKLFLPVENIDMVTRFGLEEDGVSLDKLGGASWQSRKAKLKQRITIAAEALLKIAAERQVRSGVAIDTPAGSYDDFCARFPYAETEDQDRAIADVLEDLHKGRPMDRLICGDVGFGKTEVALRAAFVVCHPAAHAQHVSAGSPSAEQDPALPLRGPQDDKYQVALVCPTTLLARQHYINFAERFKGFPVTVRQLSRMVPAKAQQETRDGIASGDVDIVIGTHALLAKNIKFKNLGLVIVDEEQHFGVGQKEKLKELKSNVHVLTLSATPIPRTLQMALTGVRDLSLITTPPIDRLAIRSFVMPFDPVVIREALLREKHRGGKSFIVTPRIKDMVELRIQIAELVPEVNIAAAHGQMAAAELDNIMNEFYDGKYDVLLATAIIESGLDIQDANTMIIHNAHLLGLAQMYQLRGRVGRGKTRAYAYFLLPHFRQLTKNATRRLEVMQTLDTLGAGFTLASHDMDIRGFGNLVGEEQSGHIKEVGIELYQQMLEEAVSVLRRGEAESAGSHAKDPAQPLRGSQDDADYSPAINLGISVLIPESYVNDLPLRLGLYRRAADMNDEKDIDSFAAELIDRFGPMPQETQHLIAVLGIKLLCRKASIERVDVGPKGAVISFRENKFEHPDALLRYIDKNARNLKIRGDQKIVLSQEWKSDGEKLAAVKKLAEEIGALG